MQTERFERNWKDGVELMAVKKVTDPLKKTVKENNGSPVLIVEDLQDTTYGFCGTDNRFQLGVAGLVYRDSTLEVIPPKKLKIYVPLCQRYDLTFSEHDLVIANSEERGIELNVGWFGLPESSYIELERSKFNVLLAHSRQTILHGPVKAMIGEEAIREYFSRLEKTHLGDKLFTHLSLDREAIELYEIIPAEERAIILEDIGF